MATITCVDCGAERTQCPRNTKRCRPCAFLNQIAYWTEDRARNCATATCRRAFAPLSRSDRHCSVCDPGLEHRTLDRCGVGARTGREHGGLILITGVKVCADCLRDPALRSELIDGLKAGRNLRRKANQWA